MRRPLRIVVNAAAALWAFLLIASIALWVHSHFVGILIRHMGPDVIPSTSYFLWSSAGTLSLGIYQQTWKDPTIGGSRYPPGFSFERWDSRAHPLSWPTGVIVNKLGFGVANARRTEGDDYTVAVPYYAITLVLLLPAVLGLVRFRRRPKAAAALRCPACGYDLRATPQRCPECGRLTLP